MGTRLSHDDARRNHPMIEFGAASFILDDQLLVGTKYAAQDRSLLKVCGVTHIVNVAEEVPCPHPDMVKYYHHRFMDTVDTDIFSSLDRIVDYIDGVLRANESLDKDANSETPSYMPQKPIVLIHCSHGVSRSGAIAIAYWMKRYGVGFEAAMKAVKSRRPAVNPNVGFQAQLRKYEALLEKRKAEGPGGSRRHSLALFGKLDIPAVSNLRLPFKRTHTT
ncbi:protein-tyrosine phosphatase-like protein [Cladochytrium replicatum]|nr:protein-tyrosine phosphatase-like protein [Cladochytrium replicatum]